MRSIGLIIWLLVTVGLPAQSVSDLLRETSLAYRHSDYFSADVTVHSYSSADGQGILLGKGLIRKSGINYYSKFQDDELIVNNKCTVILDHHDKTITWYDAAQEKKRKQRKGQQVPDIDSLYSAKDSVLYKGIENGQRHFVFFSRNAASDVRMTEVFADDQTHFITKIIYYYRSNSEDEALDMYKVVIDYSSISTQKPADSFFSESKYLSYSHNTPRLTAAYSSYELIIEK